VTIVPADEDVLGRRGHVAALRKVVEGSRSAALRSGNGDHSPE